MKNTIGLLQKPPKITICTQHYNVEEQYIREAVESILNQTFTDFEYIISDNMSNDGTAAILDQYAEKDKRVKVIHQKENDQAKANMNIILNEAHGTYFSFLDNDDYYDPTYLEEMYKLAVETSSDWTTCSSEHFFQEIDLPSEFKIGPDLVIKNMSELSTILPSLGNQFGIFFSMWTKLYRTEKLKKMFQDQTFVKYNNSYIDAMFNFEYLKNASSIAMTSKVLHHYRLRKNSQNRVWYYKALNTGAFPNTFCSKSV